MAQDFAAAPLHPVAVGGLSQVERVIDTYVAPSKTFADILRSASWWLPFLLMALFSVGVTQTVQQKVGYDRVVENQIHDSPKAEDRMAQMQPDQRARQMSIQTTATRVIAYAYPAVILIFFALYALVLWGSFNFGLGAATTFPQVLAVVIYAALPALLRSLLTIIVLVSGHDPDTFNLKNPVGTNAAYFMTDAAPWLKALLQRFDIIDLWILALTTIGMAVIARKKFSQAALVTGGLWVLATIIAVVAGAFS